MLQLDSSTAIKAWKYIFRDPLNNRIVWADGAITCYVVFARLGVENVAEIYEEYIYIYISLSLYIYISTYSYEQSCLVSAI